MQIADGVCSRSRRNRFREPLVVTIRGGRGGKWNRVQHIGILPLPKLRVTIAEGKNADFEAIGVRAELIPIIQKLGITSMAQLKEAKATKLFNDIPGMRKKLKLESVKNPTLEEIEGWLK